MRSECSVLVVVCGGVFFFFFLVIVVIMVDFDWGVVADILGLAGSICGSGFGFGGGFGCCNMVFCIWVCFELW